MCHMRALGCSEKQLSHVINLHANERFGRAKRGRRTKGQVERTSDAIHAYETASLGRLATKQHSRFCKNSVQLTIVISAVSDAPTTSCPKKTLLPAATCYLLIR